MKRLLLFFLVCAGAQAQPGAQDQGAAIRGQRTPTWASCHDSVRLAGEAVPLHLKAQATRGIVLRVEPASAHGELDQVFVTRGATTWRARPLRQPRQGGNPGEVEWRLSGCPLTPGPVQVKASVQFADDRCYWLRLSTRVR